jgi:hypothetical protein
MEYSINKSILFLAPVVRSMKFAKVKFAEISF